MFNESDEDDEFGPVELAPLPAFAKRNGGPGRPGRAMLEKLTRLTHPTLICMTTPKLGLEPTSANHPSTADQHSARAES